MKVSKGNGIKTLAIIVCMFLFITNFSSAIPVQQLIEQTDKGSTESFLKAQENGGESEQSESASLPFMQDPVKSVIDDGIIHASPPLKAEEAGQFVPGEIIVKFRDTQKAITLSKQSFVQTGLSSVDSILDTHRACSVSQNFKDNEIRDDQFGLKKVYKITFEDKTIDILDLAKKLEKDTSIEYAEPNYLCSLLDAPNDPYYSSSGSWGQSFQDLYGMHIIDTADAWNVTTGSNDVIVALVDTGVDYTHPDLAANMWTDEQGHYGHDFRNNDTDPMDDGGHGTHCAGIIAAVGNNNLGVVGVNWHTKIMALKAFPGSGSGSLSDCSNAIVWAVDHGADVISNSWGAYGTSGQETDAINYARTHNVVLVAAAGNDNTSNKMYPAAYDDVIAVAATDYNDQKASFSNYGDWVDVAAPGVDILSTVPLSFSTYTRGFVTINSVSDKKLQSIVFEYSAPVPGEGMHGQLLYAGLGRVENFSGQDFRGEIALMQRGGNLYFKDKVLNASRAGAIGAIIYNNEPGNFFGTLVEPSVIPAFSVSDTDGFYLYQLIQMEPTYVTCSEVQLGNYGVISGTSMACPHVAGLAALVLAKNQSLTPEMVKAILVHAADPVDSSVYIGSGRINANKALHEGVALAAFNHSLDDVEIGGIVTINGTAWGEHFEYYTIEYGRGNTPSSWIEIANLSSQKTNGILCSFDSTTVPECPCTLRLRVICTDGGIYEDIIRFSICNHFIVDDDGSTHVIDFTSIQDAIDHAGNGSKIYVLNGTYNENLVITKSIALYGEDKNKVFINGNNSIGIFISADNVEITGFTIRQGHQGITIQSSTNISIHDNDFYFNDVGIVSSSSNNIDISYNTVHDNGLEMCKEVSVSAYVNEDVPLRDKRDDIQQTSIDEIDDAGIQPVLFYFGGIILEDTMNAKITYNNLSNNEQGICILSECANNLLYGNNFNNNIQQAFDEGNNQWYYEGQGNYWSDYTGIDGNGDGIGDIPYNISGGNNQDIYPSMNEFETVQPTPFTVFVDDDYTKNTPGWGYDHFATIWRGFFSVKEGGTVYVCSGEYYEKSLLLYKTITLLGEGSSSVIIEGGNDRNVIQINASGVYLQGFTIKGKGIINGNIWTTPAGIDMYSNDTIISNNLIMGCWVGIHIHSLCNNIISGNTISKNYYGMYVYYSNNFTISNNDILNNSNIGVGFSNSYNNIIFKNNVTNNINQGITFTGNCKNNIISENIISQNKVGIDSPVYANITNNIITKNREDGIIIGAPNNISNNLISNNIRDGIKVWSGSEGSRIIGNTIRENSYFGVELFYLNVTLYHNNFINNRYPVYSQNRNIWDNGFPSGGNYWSDYKTKYPNAHEIDSSGLWDTPYVINSLNQDNYPFVHFAALYGNISGPDKSLTNESLSFTSFVSGGSLPYEWHWDFGDGNTITDPQNTTHTYFIPGIYTIILTVTDSEHNSIRDMKTITIADRLKADIHGPYNGLEKDPLYFVGSTTGGFSPFTYQWEFGDGSTSNLQNPLKVYSQSGVYTVNLRVTDSQNNVDTKTTTAAINKQPLGTNANGPYTGIVNESIQFSGSAYNGAPPYNWSWNFGDNTPLSYQQNPIHVYSLTGTYTALLTVTDTLGINVNDTATVIVLPDSRPFSVYVDDDFNSTTPGWSYDHFNKIQNGINAVAQNGSVFVSPGTYYGHVVINRSLNLVGENRETTIVEGGSNNRSSIEISADYVTLTGFTLKTGYMYAVDFLESSHCTLASNLIVSDWRHASAGGGFASGIFIEGPSKCVNIIGNQFIDVYMGIGAYQASYFSISENTFIDTLIGVDLYDSSYNLITRNAFSGQSMADVSFYGAYNTITENTFGSGGICFFIDSLPDSVMYWNTHTIENNTVNGKPARYYKDMNGGTIPTDTGQIILANCTHMTIQGLTVSDVAVGIQLGFSSCNTISGNTLLNNSYIGSILMYSSNNSVTGNIITPAVPSLWGASVGIIFMGSSDNIISANIIDMNHVVGTYGIYLYMSTHNTVLENVVKNSDTYGGGIELDVSSANTLIKNIVSGNSFGITLYYSSNNSIHENDVINNTMGLITKIEYKQFTTISVQGRDGGGGPSYSPSTNNTIYHNNFINNTQSVYDEYNNTWYNTSYQEGNYWSNFDEPSEGAYDNNSDDIADAPYSIPGNNTQDLYPLMHLFISIPGDLDHDGDVDTNDYHIILAACGHSIGDPSYNPEADYNRNGSVDLIDYQIWYNYYRDYTGH